MKSTVGTDQSARSPLPEPALTPITSLVPYRNNARTHSKKQITQIAKSIERFGFTNPVLIDKNATIVAGHGRVAAARQLGWAAVPTLRIDFLTEEEKRAYILADNKLAENAGWDRELLAIELNALIELQFDIEITGFDTAEVDLILDEALEAKEDVAEDTAVDYNDKESICRAGDIWIFGRHKLICGDARDDTVFSRLMGSEKAEFAFTDPPYNVPIDGHVCGLGRIRHKNFAMGCGEMTAPQFTLLLTTIFRNMSAHSASGSIHQICMDWRHIDEMMLAGKAVYSELKNLVVWNKSNAGMGSFYRSKHELIFVWKSGTASHINNFELGQHGRNRTNVWDYAGVNTFGSGERAHLALHPTVKPTALIVDALKDCSRHGSIVLDPFAGSGTLALAAERTGRRARLIEIDPHYCDVAIRRWQSATGKKAILFETGREFDEIESELTSHKTGGGSDV